MTCDEMDALASDNTLRAAERHMEAAYGDEDGDGFAHECRHCDFAVGTDGDVPEGSFVCLRDLCRTFGRNGFSHYTGEAHVLDADATDADMRCDEWRCS